MNRTLPTATLMTLRLAGALTLVLGALFWLGRMQSLIHVHMGMGLLVVLCLWLMAFLARRAAPVLALVAALWGVLVPVAGVAQLVLGLGDLQWLLQVLHLVLGLGALAQGERLGKVLRRAA
ncbi:MAG: hypothetical protein JSR19_08920 [Proteobacteria bacterium]|nr:hypothetical protein [Pseudomonadota bacterium]HQR04466.1 hypothetical protein [Rhodocyclaceae bacterium]